ncbi:MAG: tRNA (adenosine(37)-N6)-threonylcarbamoyltransferase complex dimerization subunit type 1 TsaB, partial [Gammaproteobacteria bacterium]|nr:tRNA (adenosine(37)-N6)-threonylcarbamoyltransferase complex dimerization subunit type 1 TsaB [Gammaproteobacteria bacterium]
LVQGHRVAQTWLGLGSGFAAYGAPLAAAWGAALPVVDATALPSAVHALPPGRDALLRGAGLDAAQLQPLYLRNKVALTQVEQQALRAPRQG